jgi:hypothetical protein
MTLVLWVGDRFEKFGIAPGTADVFRWAMSFSVDRAGIWNARYGIGDALYFDRVLPAVAEVLEILQRLDADIRESIGQASLAGVERSVAPARIGYAPSHVSSPDLVEMAIDPAYCRLEHQVQTIEP